MSYSPEEHGIQSGGFAVNFSYTALGLIVLGFQARRLRVVGPEAVPLPVRDIVPMQGFSAGILCPADLYLVLRPFGRIWGLRISELARQSFR